LPGAQALSAKGGRRL